jgi:hypothetical protein
MRTAHRSAMAGLFAMFFLFVAVCVAGVQEGAILRKRFTNQDVIEMAKVGLSDDVIITKIRQAYEAGTDAVSFDTSVDGLKALKVANVPDSVIKVMINPTPPPATVVAGTSPISVDPNLPPPEVRVFSLPIFALPPFCVALPWTMSSRQRGQPMRVLRLPALNAIENMSDKKHGFFPGRIRGHPLINSRLFPAGGPVRLAVWR